LPDATFLLTFVLLALPGLLVRYVRARVGCVSFNAVPLDELSDLEALSVQEAFVKHVAEIAVPVVILSVIAGLSAIVLVHNTFKIWIEEEKKETKLGSRLLANKKTKSAADATA
jgi:hypothetical protein